MAEKPDLLQVTVNFEGNRTVLHLPKNMKVGLAIQKAAEQFKQDPRGLTFLYHGNEITDDMTVGVALAQAHNVTVIHLIRVSAKKRTTAPIQPLVNREEVYGYCRECDLLVPTREIFNCKTCNRPGSFQRSSSIPINHFARELDPSLLKGACSSCHKENIEASVQFECTSCTTKDGTSVGPLRQVRKNTHNVRCMKCGLRRDTVFRFACSSRHCMCIDCFSNMCQQLLHAKKFKNFVGMGFSIGCPGPGDDCKDTPVPDPHHFKIVDVDTPKFYERFKEMSIQQYEPVHDILCGHCKTVIDFQRSKPADVKEPQGAPVPSVSGLKWYQKLLGMKPEPPAPRVRRRTSCGKCQLTYCVACKQVWHEGDCRIINDDVIKEEQAYPIDPAKAMEGCWPADKD